MQSIFPLNLSGCMSGLYHFVTILGKKQKKQEEQIKWTANTQFMWWIHVWIHVHCPSPRRLTPTFWVTLSHTDEKPSKCLKMWKIIVVTVTEKKWVALWHSWWAHYPASRWLPLNFKSAVRHRHLFDWTAVNRNKEGRWAGRAPVITHQLLAEM